MGAGVADSLGCERLRPRLASSIRGGLPSPSQGAGSLKPTAAELLATPGALLTRSHLRDLGLERRAIDAVFRALPVIVLPGYRRAMIRVEDYLELIEASTYRGDRVRHHS